MCITPTDDMGRVNVLVARSNGSGWRSSKNYGVTYAAAEAALVKHKYNEDKAADELEKNLGDMEMTEDDMLGATV